MAIRFRYYSGPLLLLAILAVVYFVCYPQDLGSIVGLVGPFIGVAEKILGLSQAVSPWLYGVLMVAIAAWAALRIAGQRGRSEAITRMD